jgi:hypothetical protein
MNQLFNYYNQAEIPSLILCAPNKEELYALPLASRIKNTIRYNALSELTFAYPKSKDGGLTTDPAYAKLQGKMLVLVNDIGYYIITSCPEDNTGSIPSKTITALSLESELLAPRLTGFSGTYQFSALLQLVLDLKPSWSIGAIDSSLLALYRTFNVNNSTAYNFLVNDMEKAYGCVFEFDTFNKTVSAYSNVIPAANTDILLTFDNLVKKINFTEITEEICTALYCYGGSNLDIHYVNPLGNNIIYDFSYFKTTEWMSQELIDALDAWEEKVAIGQGQYIVLLTLLETYNIQMVTLLADFADLNSALKSMLDIREARIQQKLDTTQIDADIAAQQIILTSKEIDIENLQSSMNSVKISLRQIVHSLFFTSQLSYHNFAEDIITMQASMGKVTTSWTNIYTSTSTSPNFDPDVLIAETPTIVALMTEANTELTTLFDFVAAGFSSYPPPAADIATLTTYINNPITTINSLYATLQGIIPSTTITIALDEIRTQLTAYLPIISYEGNMTQAQYLELTSYIYENTYTNNNIIITSIMTPVEIQEQSQILYDQALTVLAKTCRPRYEFSGEFLNFVTQAQYSAFTTQLDMGKVINIRKDDSTTIEAVLLEMSITYDVPTDFSMTFGNSFRLDNSSFIYSDILGAAAQLGSASSSSALTQGSIAGWTVSTQSINIPNASLNSKGYISFGTTPPSEFGNNIGAWLGYSNAPKFSLYSNINNYLQWDGSKLLVRAENFTLDSLGNITATNATLSGKITAAEGSIGGWTIGATALTAGTGATSVGMSTAGSYAFYAGSATPSSAPFRVTPEGEVWLENAHIAANMESDNFLTGVSGWQITSTGHAEFNDIALRGNISSVVFRRSEINTISGDVFITDGAVLIADVNNTSDVTISVDIDGFQNGDVIHFSRGGQAEWMNIISAGTEITGGYLYSVTRDLAGAGKGEFYAGDVAIRKGSSMVDTTAVVGFGDYDAPFGSVDDTLTIEVTEFGVFSSNAGGWLDLNGSRGLGPYFGVFRRIGSAYSETENIARFGNMNGFLGYTSEVYGIGIGDLDRHLRYTYDDGLEIKSGTSGTIIIDDNGISILGDSSPADVNKLKFYDDSATPVEIGSIYALYSASTWKLYLTGTVLTATPLTSITRYYPLALNGSTALTTSDAAYFRIPAALNGMNLVSVTGSVGTGAAGSSSSGLPTFTVTNVTDAQSMLTTSLTIDVGEYTSATATTPVDIDETHDDVVTDDLIKVAVTTSGTGVTYTTVTLGFALP